jgi:hypothetical protein
MLNKTILEVEKGCDKCHIIDKNNIMFCKTCQAKLSTLKECQTKFNKFVKDLKYAIKYKTTNGGINETSSEIRYRLKNEILKELDELSSKQEEDEMIKNKHIFNRVLTPEEIKELYENSKEGKDEISLCKNCYSMTKTIKGKCGKCGSKK